jgi:dTDP-glucose pyrophosphorylase
VQEVDFEKKTFEGLLVATDFSHLFISPDSSVRKAMEQIDRNAKGIVLVVDSERRLLGTITDGDIRRTLLLGQDLDASVEVVLAARSPEQLPVTAPVGADKSAILQIMREVGVRQVPLVDPQKRVMDLVTMDELLPDQTLPVQAVIMAGGLGERLRPLTEHIPKPMLPLGERPLLELLVEQLSKAGVRRVNITTQHKSEVIEQHFGNGQDFGVDIQYVKEDSPLGTAGALGMLNPSEEPLLVVNGDIFTRIDFRAMVDFHNQNQATMTVAVRDFEVEVPFGVIKTSGIEVVKISEKPVIRSLISAGIYLVNPNACALLPKGEPYDMPQLIDRIIQENEKVVSFHIREYWQDIGKLEDYEKARVDFLESGS